MDPSKFLVGTLPLKVIWNIATVLFQGAVQNYLIRYIVKYYIVYDFDKQRKVGDIILPLHVVRFEFRLVVNNNVVSWGDCSLTDVLTD